MIYLKNALSKLYVLVFAFVILMAVSAHFGMFWGITFDELLHGIKDETYPFTIDDARKVFPSATSMRRVAIDELIIKNVNDEELGVVLHTMPSCQDFIGYASSIPAFIGVNQQKQIIGLVLHENKETPWFMKKLVAAGLLDSWNGLHTHEAISHTVDAVTGATMSSKAIINSVRYRLALHEKIETKRQGLSLPQILWETIIWAYFALSLFAFFPRSPLAKYRRYLLIASVLVPGFMFARFISLDLLENWAITGLPLESQLYMVTLFVLAIFVPLFTGKGYYCAWYCPFGAAQELAGCLSKKKISFSGGTGRFLVKLRMMILIVICLLLVMGLAINLSYIEPFSVFAFKLAPNTAIYIALFFLLLSIFIRRPWCNYFCPTGQVLECVRRGYICEAHAAETANEKGSKGAYKMKISEVINLLLVVAIIVLLMGQIGGKPAAKVMKDVAVATSEDKPAKKPVAKGNELMKENQVLKIIHQRKSVRAYTDKLVTKEQFETLVRAAMAAPTARNLQPWQFFVIDDKEKLSKMAEALPYAKMLDKAPGAIVVCGEIAANAEPGMDNLWALDCAAATQNILLAAESMGLGAVWTAAYPYNDRMQAVIDVLALPETLKPLSVVPIGYPAGDEKPKDKWKPEKLHWNELK